MDSVINRIRAYNSSRVKELLPLKYGALCDGVFRFYRGTAHLFYEDLAKEKTLLKGPLIWICGDLHIENYGTYKGDNRLIYFDINDFDECVLAPVTLEILRILTSIYVASVELQINQKRADVLANRFLTKYLNTLLAGKPHSFQRETAKGIVCDLIQAAGKRKEKKLLSRRTEYNNGMMQLSIIKDKTSPASREETLLIKKAFVAWNKNNNEKYKLIDIAHRIMGTGSLGLERYILLCFNPENGRNTLLDLKRAEASCVLKYFNFMQPVWESEALRVIKIQSLMQDTPPALLNDFPLAGKSYVIKEFQPSQDKLKLKVVSNKVHKFDNIIEVMADIAASAHLRGSGRYTAQTADALIESVSERDKKQILEYARHYSKKVKSDFKEFLESIDRDKPVS